MSALASSLPPSLAFFARFCRWFHRSRRYHAGMQRNPRYPDLFPETTTVIAYMLRWMIARGKPVTSDEFTRARNEFRSTAYGFYHSFEKYILPRTPDEEERRTGPYLLRRDQMANLKRRTLFTWIGPDRLTWAAQHMTPAQHMRAFTHLEAKMLAGTSTADDMAWLQALQAVAR